MDQFVVLGIIKSELVFFCFVIAVTLAIVNNFVAMDTLLLLWRRAGVADVIERTTRQSQVGVSTSERGVAADDMGVASSTRDEALYTALGVSLGVVVVAMTMVIVVCAWRQRQQRRLIGNLLLLIYYYHYIYIYLLLLNLLSVHAATTCLYIFVSSCFCNYNANNNTDNGMQNTRTIVNVKAHLFIHV